MLLLVILVSTAALQSRAWRDPRGGGCPGWDGIAGHPSAWGRFPGRGGSAVPQGQRCPRVARGTWRDVAHGPLVTVISHRLDPCHSQLQKSPGKALAFGRVCHLAICLHSVLLHSIRINKLREEKATNAA